MVLGRNIYLHEKLRTNGLSEYAPFLELKIEVIYHERKVHQALTPLN